VDGAKTGTCAEVELISVDSLFYAVVTAFKDNCSSLVRAFTRYVRTVLECAANIWSPRRACSIIQWKDSAQCACR
jgi:hypothetical protein